ncbi:MAG TPA: hypothetical protein ENF70_05405 [Deltaproteobacteria bacterium]|nr:hypothetical protein [Deltaproteobacteria bacterium]
MDISPETIKTILIILLGTLTICGGFCVIALFGESIREILLHFFSIFYQPLQYVYDQSRQAVSSLTSWARNQIVAESEDNSCCHVIYYVAGAVICAGIAAVMVYCDLILAGQGLEAMGLGSMPDINVPEPAILLAVALIATSVFFPMMLIDSMKVTHLCPWLHKCSPLGKRIVQGFCWFSCAVMVAVFMALAYWRADISINDIFTQADAEASASMEFDSISGFDGLEDIDYEAELNLQDDENVSLPPRWIPYVVHIGAGLAILAGSILSCITAFSTFKWLTLAIGMAFSLPLFVISFVANLLSIFINFISSTIEKILNLLINMGNSILRLFGRRSINGRERPGDADSPQRQAQNVTSEEFPRTDMPSDSGSNTEEKEQWAPPGSSQAKARGFDPFG